MGESVGIHHSAAHALEAIVADRGGRMQRFLEIAGLEDVAARGGMRPNARVAVRVQLPADRFLVLRPKA